MYLEKRRNSIVWRRTERSIDIEKLYIQYQLRMQLIQTAQTRAYQRIFGLPIKLFPQERNDRLKAIRRSNLVEVLLHDRSVASRLETDYDCPGLSVLLCRMNRVKSHSCCCLSFCNVPRLAELQRRDLFQVLRRERCRQLHSRHPTAATCKGKSQVNVWGRNITKSRLKGRHEILWIR